MQSRSYTTRANSNTTLFGSKTTVEQNENVSKKSGSTLGFAKRVPLTKNQEGTTRVLGDITNKTGTTQVAKKKLTTTTQVSKPKFNFSQNYIDVSCLDDNMVIDSPQPLWEDIDAGDRNDPQSVTEIVNDIYDYCFEAEVKMQIDPGYMKRQPEITQRMHTILLDWLIDVHLKFKLLPETLFLTQYLIDKYLEIKAVPKDQLQLLGITCMFVASKYEEIYPPECNDFIYISANAYTKEQILLMEQTILNTLQFRVTAPTSLYFLRRFSKAAKSDYNTHTLCKYLIELAMTQYDMLKFMPSKIAAASVYLARMMNQEPMVWNNTLTHYTKYNQDDLVECVEALAHIARHVTTQSQQAAYRKYSTKRFLEVALMSVPLL